MALRSAAARRTSGLTILLPLALTLLAGDAPWRMAGAHSSATGVVKERMDLMSGMGEAMKAMAAMFKKQAPYDPEALARHAAAISHQTEAMAALFPEGSHHQPSKALPSIWSDWPAFTELATELGNASARLAEMAPEADARQARRQFARVARVCSNCHERYRTEP